MDLKDLIKALARNYFFIAIFCFIGTLSAVLITVSQKSQFVYSYPIFVTNFNNISENGATSNWYDPTDTSIGIIRQVAQTSAADGSTLDVKKVTTKVLSLESNNTNSQFAIDDLNNFIDKSNEEIFRLTSLDSNQITLQKISDAPNSQVIKPNLKINLLAGLLLGSVLSFSLIFLKIYFEKK